MGFSTKESVNIESTTGQFGNISEVFGKINQALRGKRLQNIKNGDSVLQELMEKGENIGSGIVLAVSLGICATLAKCNQTPLYQCTQQLLYSRHWKLCEDPD